MLKYRINRRKFNKTKVNLVTEEISITDFNALNIGYDGENNDKLMITCKCTDIDKIDKGSFINTVNTLYLSYGYTEMTYNDVFTFDNDYQTSGVNKGNNSFSFYIDKYWPLKPKSIKTISRKRPVVYEGEDEYERNVYLYFEESHYFDVSDYANENGGQNIPIYFRNYHYNSTNVPTDKAVIVDGFTFLTPYVLVCPYSSFDPNLRTLIFGVIPNELQEWDREGVLAGIDVYRNTFLFGEKTNYQFSFVRPIVNINVPLVSTFETNLFQTELLNKQFVETEKEKAINKITDIEKDIYYPCIYTPEKITDTVTTPEKFTNVYTIKFNLHFREHRQDEWLAKNDSFWNGVVMDENDNKLKIAECNIGDDNSPNNVPLTSDSSSDLLGLLWFRDSDVHYQKNKLKKSFLRLSFYDSTNPGNQNLIGYSTIYLDSGLLFKKYIENIEKSGYVVIGNDITKYGKYEPVPHKTGIRVDRDYFDENNLSVEELRLSSQFVVKSKNTSNSSSEGFYLYIWKDNEMALPQDLYMKVEFNHAGFGRTIPFMMPYWDRVKWKTDSTRKEGGIKSFNEILDDWNSEKDSEGKWRNGNTDTDGHYGIKQYNKFSYIHLKYRYNKEEDKHVYYLDNETYGDSVTTPSDELVINLYEAKVE